MSLLQNQDFLIWQLRTSYLTNVKDGVGERLINLDCGVLNDPSFRAAGWTASIADLRRTHSPPIPTAFSSDYYSGPPLSAGFANTTFLDDEDEGGILTGRGSTDTVGPGPELRRRRRREQQGEDDSSDLSDDSDDEKESAPRAAQQIKFAKMPLRERAGSSPIRKPKAKEGMELPVTSPSRRSAEGRLRSGSVEAVESLKQRARKGTLTGSDMSSENELDPEVFKRRHVNPRKAGKAATAGFGPSGEGESLHLKNQPTTIDEDSAEYSDRTSLSSEFGATADSESILNHIGDPKFSPFDPVQPKIAESPKKPRAQSLELQALPPRRPISTIQPKSLLSQSLRGGPSEPKNPLESFAMFSGKGDLDPLNIRMYAPFSDNPSKPFEIPLLRVILSPKSWTKVPVTVADAIGFSLWRYCEEKLQPPIEASKLSVNRWTLRMVEDGDVDYDFPALSRNKPIGDFTSNNNRAARGRSKEKSYDEFALVEATDAQTKENQTLTPKYDQLTPTVKDNSIDKPQIKPQDHKHASLDPVTASSASTEKPIYIRNDTPAGPSSQPKQRKIPIKTLRIHYTNLEAVTETTIMQIPYETNLAEVFEAACARWSLDKIGHVLRVSGKHVVVPLDQPVKVIGDIIDLVLVERRFFKEGYFGSAGSPRSSSPNAPLLLTSNTSPQKGKRGGAQPLRPYQEHWGTGVAGQYKRYNVTRKQPMSFAPSHQRVLLIDEEYLHILPVETSKTFFESSAKSVQIPFSMIVGCKISRRHPKSFHIFVFRERETKRYDFEAQDASEAAEIVQQTIKSTAPFQDKRVGAG